MKPAIKKLKTCTYSKDLASSAAAFGQREAHTNKLVCDHPEMKLNWNEKVCGPCTVYENRNAELVIPAPQPPQPAPPPPARTASPAPVKPPSPVVAAPRVSPAPAIPAQAEAPKKTAPKPANKPAAAGPLAPPAESATRAKAPVKETKVSGDTRAKSLARPKATREQLQKSAKKTATKPKQK